MNPYQPPSLAAESTLPAPAVVEPFTSVTGLMGRALSFFFGNITTIASITLVVFAPVELAKNLFVHATKLDANAMAASRIDMLVESVFGSLVAASLLQALAHKIRTGRDLGVGAALTLGMKSWSNVFAARFRVGLYMLLGAVLLVVPAIYWAVKYSLVDEIVVLDGSSSRRALDASGELTRGHGWKILGVGFLAVLPIVVAQFAGGVVAGLTESWLLTAVVDCVNDVIYRFFIVVTLLVYLGVGGRMDASEDDAATPAAA